MRLPAVGPLVAALLLAGCATAPRNDDATHSRVSQEETPGEPGSIEVKAEHPRPGKLVFTGYAIAIRGEDGKVREETSFPALFVDLPPGRYDVAVGTFEDPQGLAQVIVRPGVRSRVDFWVGGGSTPAKASRWDAALDTLQGLALGVLGAGLMVGLLSLELD